EGPLALLPLGGARRTLVWSLSAARAAELAAAPLEAFAHAAARRLGRGLAPVSVQRVPVAQPLQRIEAESVTGMRSALIGNAARTLHPVGAQGFNLALRDVCTLAESVLAAADPGSAELLDSWRRRRQSDQRRTRAFTDVLARGFHGGGGAAAAARAGALLGLDLVGAGRHGLAAQTTGLLGGLPRVGRWRVGADASSGGEAP
ncbi:MAG: FAD-dependent monooxygenase, partial [Halofilum sp. (in: g-proteobacteria)]